MTPAAHLGHHDTLSMHVAVERLSLITTLYTVANPFTLWLHSSGPHQSLQHFPPRTKFSCTYLTMAALDGSLKIRCLCGAVSQTVSFSGNIPASLHVCHCHTCRHTSGVLCSSYIPVDGFSPSPELQGYASSDQSTRYFCKTCGCHVARSATANGNTPAWQVATGTMVASAESPSQAVPSDEHVHVNDTIDGGLSVWLDAPGHHPSRRLTEQPSPKTGDVLSASCACSAVRLAITRPDASSRIPSRRLPDLTHSDFTTPEAVKANPSDHKWWLSPCGTRYLAGTCACRSCRLATGFEIQTWAFIPRSNLAIYSPTRGAFVALDFDDLPASTVQTHVSSPGVKRHFCGTCGATVFWREAKRADVVDVGVGLLQSATGARAEDWLYWWTGRVSFVEDVELDREGFAAQRATALMRALESGMSS